MLNDLWFKLMMDYLNNRISDLSWVKKRAKWLLKDLELVARNHLKKKGRIMTYADSPHYYAYFLTAQYILLQ